METVFVASPGIVLPDRSRPAPQRTRGNKCATARFQFVNIEHPGETSSGQSLSVIRSHAAKQVHASRRNNQATLREAADGSFSTPDDSLVLIHDKTLTEDAELEKAFRLRKGKRIPHVPQKNQRAIRVSHDLLQSPIQIIGGSVKDSCRVGFARNLSQDEYQLFEFYTQWFLKYGSAGCVPVEMEAYFFHAQTTSLLPFTMARSCLLSGMLYIAARRLSVNTSNASDAHKFDLKATRYRLQCLELMREAIRREPVPSDETITLALMMCAEAFREGDQQATRAHAHAVFQMVTTRGGLKTLTVMSGFLEYLLVTSIWDPRYKLLSGPASDDEH